jgi:hypothetical protein
MTVVTEADAEHGRRGARRCRRRGLAGSHRAAVTSSREVRHKALSLHGPQRHARRNSSCTGRAGPGSTGAPFGARGADSATAGRRRYESVRPPARGRSTVDGGSTSQPRYRHGLPSRSSLSVCRPRVRRHAPGRPHEGPDHLVSFRRGMPRDPVDAPPGFSFGPGRYRRRDGRHGGATSGRSAPLDCAHPPSSSIVGTCRTPRTGSSPSGRRRVRSRDLTRRRWASGNTCISGGGILHDATQRTCP